MESRRFADSPEAINAAQAAFTCDRLREVILVSLILFYFRVGPGGPFVVLGTAMSSVVTMRMLTTIPAEAPYLPEHWRTAACGLVLVQMAAFGLPFTGNASVLWTCLFVAPWCMILFTLYLMHHWRGMLNTPEASALFLSLERMALWVVFPTTIVLSWFVFVITPERRPGNDAPFQLQFPIVLFVLLGLCAGTLVFFARLYLGVGTFRAWFAERYSAASLSKIRSILENDAASRP